MQNIKIEYVNGALVALERDGLSFASLPVSEFPIDSAAFTLSKFMLEDLYATTS